MISLVSKAEISQKKGMLEKTCLVRSNNKQAANSARREGVSEPIYTQAYAFMVYADTTQTRLF